MEATRRAIGEGRCLADGGRFAAAMDAWKAALSGAYNLQDFAGMFVLSSNLGETCVQIATRSTDGDEAAQLLQEATEHLDYALQVVDQCSLREVLGGYRALYRSVRRVETVKRKAKKLMEKLQLSEEPAKQNEVKWTCSTCGVASANIVLDENDGCYYCRACYDAYYSEGKTGGEVAAVGELACAGDEAVEEVLDVVEKCDEKERDEGLCRDAEDSDGEAVALASDPTSERVEAVPVSDDERTDEVAHERNEEMPSDRLRYERVELGSLADFLAGKVYQEDQKPQQIENQQNSSPRDLPVSSTTATSHTENIVIESVAESNAQNVEPSESITSDLELPTPSSDVDEAARAEEVPVLNEDSAETVPDKYEYSITELLELRQPSPVDCPKALLGSPVYDDGTTRTPGRNNVNNSRKKPKKTARSAASHEQNKTEPDPEKADEERAISPLPTLDMVDAMRKALEERRQQTDAGLACDNGARTVGLFHLPGLVGT